MNKKEFRKVLELKDYCEKNFKLLGWIITIQTIWFLGVIILIFYII